MWVVNEEEVIVRRSKNSRIGLSERVTAGEDAEEEEDLFFVAL